jgi:hypothetical protein
MKKTREIILEKILNFRQEFALSECKFGDLSVKNHKIVHYIRIGRGVSLKTIDKIEDFIEEKLKERKGY